MSRGARLAVGLSLAGVLLGVSLVSVVVGAVLAADGSSDAFFDDQYFDDQYFDDEYFDEGYLDEYMTARTDAEVLDVDDEYGWTWVDVRFSAAGEVVVTGFDWDGEPAPRVGDLVEVAYDPTDPEYAMATGASDVPGTQDVGPDPSVAAPIEGDTAPPPSAVTAFWVAGVSGGLALLAVVLTVVWSARAPEPRPRAGHMHGYWSPPGVGAPPLLPRPHPGQPYSGQLYSGQPYSGQTTGAQPYAPPPAPTGWGTPSG